MSNPYAPPTVDDLNPRYTFRWRIAGITLVTLGLITPVIGLMLFGILPIRLGGIVGLLILSAGIATVSLSLPTQTESERRRKRMLFWMIPVLSILIIGGTLIFHTVRLSNQVRAAQEAMYQRDMAQQAFEQGGKAAEQSELQQHEINGSPERD